MSEKILTEGGKNTLVDKSYVAQLTQKWGSMLEGVKNPYVRGTSAMLLENQAGFLRSLNEDTLSTNVGSFTKYIFPILRRVFPNLIANQTVSVQPGLSVQGLMVV